MPDAGNSLRLVLSYNDEGAVMQSNSEEAVVNLQVDTDDPNLLGQIFGTLRPNPGDHVELGNSATITYVSSAKSKDDTASTIINLTLHFPITIAAHVLAVWIH